MNINDSPVTLVNIYGPNSDDGNFCSELHELLCNYGEEPYILVEDFNTILNPKLDKFPKLIQNHLNCYNAIQNIISDFELVDVWRHLHPAALKYTWMSHDCKSGSRLDYFLISQSFIQSVKKSEITFGYRSDHLFVSLHLTKSVIKRSPGFRKLNTALLADADVVDSIRDEIKIVLTENAGSSFSKIWEFMKFSVHCKFIEISKKKKRERRMRLEEKKINRLTNNEECCNNETLRSDLCDKKKEYEHLHEEIVRGNIVRTKAKWVSEGERNTKCFFNLEKKEFSAKIIFQASNGKWTYYRF